MALQVVGVHSPPIKSFCEIFLFSLVFQTVFRLIHGSTNIPNLFHTSPWDPAPNTKAGQIPSSFELLEACFTFLQLANPGTSEGEGEQLPSFMCLGSFLILTCHWPRMLHTALVLTSASLQASPGFDRPKKLKEVTI